MPTVSASAWTPPAGTTPAELRLAGAPISWGICEVPGWGHQLTAQRVLRELGSVGLRAAEFGPDGFLCPVAMVANGITPVGGFAPVVAHRDDHDPLEALAPQIAAFAACGADVLVVAAVSGCDGYDQQPVLDDAGAATLVNNLDRIDAAAAQAGVRAVLHPHVGTMIETTGQVQQVLDGSRIGLCLDTGHLMIGGTDPIDLLDSAAHRIAHVHLKDVDAAVLARVRSGELTYTDGVRAGMYRPVGHGDVDIAGVVARLRAAGYAGWWVLEQDTILAGEPDGPGPVTDVARSVNFLRALP
ncbi:TIM barrel protein [Williamsia sp. CHRR-6]|uniref:TIM barrel protein n=1 Tax=Williamsia sp. CHRR-6 TaxID=2835871 RepID=UPI0027DC42E0|nr:TIM barrel protein [Williamsia sp. CHRR-6]